MTVSMVETNTSMEYRQNCCIVVISPPPNASNLSLKSSTELKLNPNPGVPEVEDTVEDVAVEDTDGVDSVEVTDGKLITVSSVP
jgi:hypothetical protein